MDLHSEAEPEVQVRRAVRVEVKVNMEAKQNVAVSRPVRYAELHRKARGAEAGVEIHVQQRVPVQAENGVREEV